MKKWFLPRFIQALLFCSVFVIARDNVNAGAKEEEDRKRLVNVVDCIEMTKLGAPEYWRGGYPPGGIAQFSRDMRRFVIVLRKGNLERNTNDYSLFVWQTDEVFQSPVPFVLLTMSSSSNREAIVDLNWLNDNETVAFLGEQPGELRQLYTFNLRTKVLKRVTNHPTSLTSYSITPKGNEFAYVAETPPESIWDTKTQREGFVISNQVLANLVAGLTQDNRRYNGDRQLFFRSASRITGPLDTKGKIDPLQSVVSLSPDGNHIVIPAKVSPVPEQWKEYSDPKLQNETIQKQARGEYSSLRRYILVDTRTGESHVLMNSPVGHFGAEVAWAPDSRSVAISGVYLPLENTSTEVYKARRSKTFAVEVAIPSGGITKITEEDLRLLEWKPEGLVFDVRSTKAESDQNKKILFRRSKSGWEKASERMETEERPRITLEEEMNHAPKIFATDLAGHQKKMLLDLNPQFKDLTFAKVEEVEWKGSDGRVVKGGLYYPDEYTVYRRYPLVIQTHGWRADKFWIDGPWTSAFAAQALASKNFVVLQMPDPGEDFEETPEEAPRAVAAIEGAIDSLASKGLIDRNRVGLVGFSRTGLYVRYALTHSRYKFGAASVMDSNDGGYFAYLALSNSTPGWAEYNDGVNGAAPFGEGLKKWEARSPGFNINKVCAPFRIVAPRSGNSVLMEWEWFAALTRLERPVEMIMLQDGEHILQKPLDRMVSQQGNVDWFCFWLKGEEDSEPAKKEQYERWRELRKLQEGQLGCSEDKSR